nr:TniQ family protein [Streptomyces coelicoflavus]
MLRLAHRLGTTPAEIALRTGLAPGGRPGLPTRFPLSFQHHLDDAHLTGFARATYLTPTEVTDMLLAPLGQRYGPLDPVFTPRNTPARMIYDDPWVLTRSTRYCPPCLAGNVTPIQDRHGGPWQRLWRLPVIFLCVRHRRLLSHQCLGCDMRAQSARTASALARISDDALNPRQCRSAQVRSASTEQPAAACGADLTQQGPLHEEPDPATMKVLLHVQRHLANLIAVGGPETTMSAGAPVPVWHYFADLRTVVAMIFRTWPEARPYSSTPPWPPRSTRNTPPAPRRPSPCSRPPARRRPPSLTPRRRRTPWPWAQSWTSRPSSSQQRSRMKRESSWPRLCSGCAMTTARSASTCVALPGSRRQ